AERRRADPRRLEQDLDATPLTSIRLEELEHPFVRSAWLPREGPRHDVGQVVVADRDRVRIPERDPAHLAGRPRADAGKLLQECPGLRRRGVAERGDLLRVSGDLSE